MTKTFASAASASALALLFAVSPASAQPAGVSVLAKAAAPKAIVQVHDDWDDDEDEAYHHRRRWHHRHHEVDAPFTHVETGRRVIVEAPFASVYVGRHGRHIRAPFVDLWVPR